MKNWMAIFSIFMVVVLTACGNSDDDVDSSGEGEGVPAAIEANISVPDEMTSSEEVNLEVSVTQGNEPVEDAEEVKFEVWEDGNKDDSVLVEAEHESEGNYAVSYTFKSDGVFHIQSHVTARKMHTMPKIEVVVGNVEESKESTSDEVEDHDHDEHEHGGDVAIHISPTKDITVNEATKFDIHITKEEQGLQDANVRLEIISLNKKDEVAWVDAIEETEGTYKVTHTFTDQGKYRMVVHVENNEGLHEHIEQNVTVN